jgi:hypothetical protein
MDWRRCAVCSHAARPSIDRKIRQGDELEVLAQYYGVTVVVLRRHRDSHLTTQLPSTAVHNAVVTTSRMDPEAMFEQHEDCIRECRELIDYARAKQNVMGWARGITEWRACLHQQNMMLGIYHHVDPRLAQARSQRIIDVVSEALERYPEARGEVLAAIELVEEEDDVSG